MQEEKKSIFLVCLLHTLGILYNRSTVCLTFLLFPFQTFSGMHQYSYREGPIELEVFTRKLCSKSIQMLHTVACLLDLIGWASWDPYCVLRLMKLLLST